MRVPQSIVDAMVAHAREDAPDECCGLIGARDGQAARLYRARNRFASPYRYELEPADMHRILEELDDEGMNLGILYHSHPRTAPEPSQTDINLANPLLGDVLYAIVSLRGDEPEIRYWRIAGNTVQEVDVAVV